MFKIKSFFLILFLLVLNGETNGSRLNEIDIFRQHLHKNKAQIRDWAAYYLKSHRTEHKPLKFPDARFNYIDCPTCLLAVPAARLAIQLGLTDLIINIAVGICNDLELIPTEGCDGLIRAFVDPVLGMLIRSPDLTAGDFCGILIADDCGTVNPDFLNWEINIDSNKPDLVDSPPLPDNLETVKIIQLTDVHVDLDYKEGSLGNCGSIVGCCRDGTGEGPDAAGKYGHDGCEMPEIGYEEILTHASTTHSDAKYVFLTGDFIHSVLWTYNKEENTRVHSHVFSRAKEYFPDTLIIPVVGNHEPDVVNQYSPPNTWEEGFDLGWLYILIDEHFPGLIPDDQKEDFLNYGYYHMSPEPGFRFVMINSNLAYLDNFWLPHYAVDPYGELAWIEKTLLAAEQAGEIVYIIGHVAPGSGGCWGKWSEQFDRIVNRYEGIIKGQFYGHGHDDEFKIHFEPESERATNVMYIGPAGTPDRGGYAYKTYLADGAREDPTWEIVDHDEWVMDLASSNEAGVANWSLLYTASTTFGMESQRPSDIYNFVLRMIEDHQLFNTYQWTYSKGHRNSYTECGVEDKNCKINYLCDTVKGNNWNPYNCDIIRRLVDPPAEDSTTTESPESTTSIADETTENPVEDTTTSDSLPETTRDPVEDTTTSDSLPETTTNIPEETTRNPVDTTTSESLPETTTPEPEDTTKNPIETTKSPESTTPAPESTTKTEQETTTNSGNFIQNSKIIQLVMTLVILGHI